MTRLQSHKRCSTSTPRKAHSRSALPQTNVLKSDKKSYNTAYKLQLMKKKKLNVY